MNPVPFGKPVLLSTRRVATMPSIERLTEIYVTAVYDHWHSPSSGDPGVPDDATGDVRAGIAAVVNALLDAQLAIVTHSKTIFDDVDATLDTTLILPELDDYDATADWLQYLKGDIE